MPVAPLTGALAQRVLDVAARSEVDRRRTAEAASAYHMRFLGDPVLLQAADAVPLDGSATDRAAALHEVRALGSALRRICSERKYGVAIAAQQVGATVAVVLTPVKGLRTVMVNPRIVGKSRKKETAVEGCLSIPEFWMSVERYTWITVEFTPEDLSEPIRVKLTDFEARAAQHELDHLAGVCIVHRKGVTRQQRRHAERCVAKARL